MDNNPALFGALCIVVIFVSALGTRWLISAAPRLGLIDTPNQRSSHVFATPRAGGVAFVFAWCLGIALSANGFGSDPFNAICLPALAVATIGLVDDRRGVPPLARALVHAAVAAWILAVVASSLESLFTSLGMPVVLGFAVAGISIVWGINLFNFMDGIDGLAASQAALMSIGLSLSLLVAGSTLAAYASALLGAAVIGFLIWNWPPGRIFMGDVGSGFLGCALAAITLIAMRDGALTMTAALLLWAAFLVDATVTLLVRLARGESPAVAHRTHLYQQLTRRGWSHARVTLAYCAYNLLLVAPATVFALMFPSFAPWLAGLVLGATALLAILLGAGREPDPSVAR
jgi:Fuc2NAc and GlcNAc transferase